MQNADKAQRLGHLIREARTNSNLSIRQLSERSGVPRTTITRIEGDEVRRPRPDILTALGRALGLPIEDLYAAVNYSTPHNLPSLAPYLRARYRDLSPHAIDELQVYLETLAEREGVSLEGPPNGEDELA